MTYIPNSPKGGIVLNQWEEYASLAEISDQEAEELCRALRRRVIQVVSKTGGQNIDPCRCFR